MAFRRAGQVVPQHYAHTVTVMNALSLELSLLRLGYPYDYVRNMTLQEALLRRDVLGAMHG